MLWKCYAERFAKLRYNLVKPEVRNKDRDYRPVFFLFLMNNTAVLHIMYILEHTEDVQPQSKHIEPISK